MPAELPQDEELLDAVAIFSRLHSREAGEFASASDQVGMIPFGLPILEEFIAPAEQATLWAGPPEEFGHVVDVEPGQILRDRQVLQRCRCEFALHTRILLHQCALAHD